MAKMTLKQENALRRAGRARAKVFGTSSRPRLSVFISNRHIVAQIVDDEKGVTLAHATTLANTKGTMTERAAAVGAEIAEKATKIKVKKVVFDRGSRLYAGRLKALADAAREKGLEF